MELPKRKSLRLQSYDYSQNGAYFITICTQNKKCILGDIGMDTGDIVGDGVLDIPFIMLSHYGKIVEQTILDIAKTYDDVEIPKYIIMPNHIHMIVHIENKKNGLSRTPTPTRANARIPSMVSTLKRFSNKKCGESIWQRSYHEHVIRNQTSYEEIWQYIDTNPIKWELDCYYTT
ncbi:transposase [Chakrabartyella piscis]|uniref:transposase n=1 Tax=Chakrabartyella piscis TaxID=2918914 RepID=UPI002958D2FB|nr:transposase [Chakrabartyella piscis]